jgi:pyruvate/2-oxoglutarate dehydrogenase complex dihydrolipoamide acyltransferase (E2) component
MESGSISKWNLKEGDRFEPGTSLCDVETDKAVVSFDATDEGYLAKILVGSGEVKVRNTSSFLALFIANGTCM